MSRFFCLYITDFPAWAVAWRHAELRDKPLLVHARGKVVATSPLARQAGARRGWTLPRAQALVENAIVVPQHAATEQLAWDAVLAKLYQLTPRLESVRLGLAFADLPLEKPIVALVRDWRAQGGLADDRTTAELAALTTRYGAVRRIHTGKSAAFLERVPVFALEAVGVGGDSIERMGWFGWHSVGQLRRLTRPQLDAQFPEAALLFRYAHANDTRAVPNYLLPPSIGTHWYFDEPAEEPYEWEPVLDHLVEAGWAQLQGRTTSIVTVSVETGSRRLTSRRLLRDGLAAERPLRHIAYQLLASFAGNIVRMTRLEVCLGGLRLPLAVQQSLFAVRRPSIEPVLHRLEKRFPGSMQRIVALDPDAYLPEARYRYAPSIAAQATDKQPTVKIGTPRSRSRPVAKDTPTLYLIPREKEASPDKQAQPELAMRP